MREQVHQESVCLRMTPCALSSCIVGIFFMCVSPQPLKWISVSVLESWRVAGCTSHPDVAHQREPLTHTDTQTHTTIQL